MPPALVCLEQLPYDLSMKLAGQTCPSTLLCPAPNRRGIKRCFVWRLSVAYIGSNSRTERPRKAKIGTEVAHITRDSDITFKVKRSRSPGSLTQRGLNAWGRCSDDRENVLGVGNYRYAASARRRARRWGAHEGRRGAGTYRVATRTAC